jgi:hypothetical protein
LPDTGVFYRTLARFGPTTPKRARRLADASVVPTDARWPDLFRCQNQSNLNVAFWSSRDGRSCDLYTRLKCLMSLVRTKPFRKEACQGVAKLLPPVYDELRTLTAAGMAAEASGRTLDAAALVHEAYLKLVGAWQFDSRGHFFPAAAGAMRRILVDHARARMAAAGRAWRAADLSCG